MKCITIIAILLLACYYIQAQTLEDYCQTAAENNPGLLARHKDFEAALEKAPQVSTLPDPTLSFGYFISPAETRVGPQRARISLVQMFPWGGTLKAQGDAATLKAEAAYQTFLDARNFLFYQVSEAYYPLHELQQLRMLEQENIQILESFKNIASKKFETGTGTMVDILRVDIILNDARTELSILRNKEKPLLVAFNKLLNRDEQESVVLTPLASYEILPARYRRDSLLIENPLLDGLHLNIQAQEAMERAARKQGLPKIGVGIDYVLVGERTDLSPGMAIPEDNGMNMLMPMVSVSMPIFRNKYRAAAKEAQLMKESYSLRKADYTNALTAEYEMAWFGIQQQQALLTLYDRQITASDQSLTLLYTAYSNSGSDIDEVLQMQQQLLKYKKMQAAATTQYFSSIAKIDYLTSKND